MCIWLTRGFVFDYIMLCKLYMGNVDSYSFMSISIIVLSLAYPSRAEGI